MVAKKGKKENAAFIPPPPPTLTVLVGPEKKKREMESNWLVGLKVKKEINRKQNYCKKLFWKIWIWINRKIGKWLLESEFLTKKDWATSYIKIRQKTLYWG